MKIQLLDHGYIEFIEAWGHGKGGTVASSQGTRTCEDTECGIIEAARQSTQGSFRGWHKDEKLLAYLFNHNHSTPFEFAGMVIEVQAPIFVFREWQRHRTQSYNEMSARYEPLPDLYYAPSIDRLMLQQKGNKQSEGLVDLTEAGARLFRNELISDYETFSWHYKAALLTGVPKELARLGMPVGHYSRMRASTSLRNWLAFLTLRMDPAAQWEIRQYANAVYFIIQQQFPRTAKLFEQQFTEEI